MKLHTLPIVALVGMTALVINPNLLAADGEYTATGTGKSWSDTANWTGGTVPDGEGDIATFSNSASTSVSISGNVTLGGIVVGNVGTGAVTISGGTLTFDALSGTPSISAVNNAGLTINSVVAGTEGFSYTGANSNSRFTLGSGSGNTISGQIQILAGNLIYNSASDALFGATGVGNETIIGGHDTLAAGINFGSSDRTIQSGEIIVIKQRGGFNFDTGANQKTATINASLVLEAPFDSGRGTVNLASTATYNRFIFNGDISGAGHLSLRHGNNGGLVMTVTNSANSYSGGTSIQAGSNTTALLADGANALILGIGADGALGSGEVEVLSSRGVLASDDASARTLANDLKLTANQTAFGNTGLTAAITAGGSALKDLVGNGDLTFNGATTLNGTTTKTLTVWNRTNFAGGLAGTADISLKGGGTLGIGGNSTYSGTITTSESTHLVVNGTFGGSLNIGASSRLSGTAVIAGPVTISGALAPGNSIGTLTVNNNLTWNSGEAWQFELGAGNTSDSLSITGDFLKGTGTDFAFDFLGTGVADGTYTLATWSGISSFVGTEFTYLNLADGLSGAFTFNSNSLQFVVTGQNIPEPSTFAALIGALALAWTATRRSRA